METKLRLFYIFSLLLFVGLGFYLNAEDTEKGKIGLMVNKVHISTGQTNPTDENARPDGNFYSIQLFGKTVGKSEKIKKAVISFLPDNEVLPPPIFKDQQIFLFYHKSQFPVIADLLRPIQQKRLFISYEEKTGPEDKKTVWAKIDILRQPAKKILLKKKDKKKPVKSEKISDRGK